MQEKNQQNHNPIGIQPPPTVRWTPVRFALVKILLRFNFGLTLFALQYRIHVM